MPHPTPSLPQLKPQEIPFDDPGSDCFFVPGSDGKPFVATPAALDLYGQPVIVNCLLKLQDLAREHGGIDYLQAFTDPGRAEPLWFIEDGPGGAITALLPSDY